MLPALAGRLKDRKATLYVCGGARSLWPLLYDERTRDAVGVAERAADGAASPGEVEAARYYAESPTFGFHFDPGFVRAHRDDPREGASVRRLLKMGAYTEEGIGGGAALADEQTRSRLVGLADVVYLGFRPADGGEFDAALVRRLRDVAVWPNGWLVRCVFGNPCRPRRVNAAWRSPAAVALAWAAYDQRELPAGHLDLARLLALADALEEAGATDAALLGHLRSPGPHVRGCHAVDALLGLE
jgi:hypothetical protein